MTLRNKFLQAGTGEFLNQLSGPSGGSVYDSSLSFRHLRYVNSFGESNPSLISNHPTQLVYDEKQGIYRLWNVQSLTSAAGVVMNSIWQEYCSSDLVTWVFNRTYNVRALPTISDIYSTFIDELNLFGFGKVRVYQFLCTDGNIYNAYGPELGLEPVTDGVTHSPISFYNKAAGNYIDLRNSSVGSVNVVTYTTSETGTTTQEALASGITSLYTGNGKSINTVRLYTTDDKISYGYLGLNGSSICFCPLIDSTGAINNALPVIPLINSGYIESKTGAAGLYCSHDDTNLFFPVTGG